MRPRTVAVAPFERPEHRRAVERGILAGVLSLKFAYAGSAAYTHDTLTRQEGYQAVTGPASHVRETLRRAGLDDLPDIVEIGPGNGTTSLALIHQLQDAKQPPRRFLGLDFSRTLLDLAGRNFAAERPDVDFTAGVWDVEGGGTPAIRDWRLGGAPVPVLFLGSTVGNLEDPAGALRHIHDSMGTGDTLVLGATLRGPGTDAAAMVGPYRTDVFRAAALEPLLACGLGDDDLGFTVEYTGREVVGTATLRRPVALSGAELPAGHRVRCFRSRRFTAAEIDVLIRRAGLEPLIRSVDEPADHLVLTAVKESDDDLGARPAR